MSRSPRAREIAVRRLLRVEDDGAFVARLGNDALDPAEARRASGFVAGVTRQRRWLDFLLDAFYRGDVEALQPELRQILRVGLYDLVVRETPPHAAVSEAVAAARVLLHRGAAGLTNAVLRAASRAHAAGTLPEPSTGNVAGDLAVRYSHPTWLVKRWLARWPRDEVEALLTADNAAPAFGLRVNTLRATRDEVLGRLRAMGVDARPSEYLDDAVVTRQLQPVLRSELVGEGVLAVQDEAAALVVRVLDPQPGEAVLDAAAAPGGKAIAAAIRMGDRGRLVALDLSEAKTRLVAEAAGRHGVSIVEAVAGDLLTWEPDAVFDRVLLDAPCSGTGVLAKRADLRWNRSPEDVASLAELQDALLDAAARHVRPGGTLVYSTCSIEPEENEDRVGAFVERHRDFSPVTVGDSVPAAMVRPDGTYAALPHVHGTDGAFAARLLRSPT